MTQRVLVIYKKSTYQRYVWRNQALLKQLLAAEDKSVQGLLEEHEVHQQTIAATKKALKGLGVRPMFRYRPEPAPESGWDLIVTLGGDGTLLWASHLADSTTPMVAINSAPDTSVGYFCAGHGDIAGEILEGALNGRLKATKLARVRVDVGDTTISKRVLNDALFCHESPAATTRYILEFQGDSEKQMSSGVWVGPAAGSTAAIRSAGGRVLPIGSQKVQFVVREPYRGVDNRYRLTKGLFAPGESIAITSRMTRGRLFLDGTQKTSSVTIGDTIRLQRSDEPLVILGLNRKGNRDAQS